MKKLIALVILALLGFYVAWPAWSGYRIFTALRSNDAALLESKIDFPRVRQSMRPAVEIEVDKQIDAQLKQAGGGAAAALGGELKKQLAPKLVDTVLESVVTPANVLRIAAEGGNVAGTVQKILAEQMGKAGGLPGLGDLTRQGGSDSGGGRSPGGLGGVIGGLGGFGGAAGQLGIPGFGGGSPQVQQPPPQPAPAASGGGKPSYGLSNIKGFGLDGPLGYWVSLARNGASAKPDVTAGMSFSGFDWKVTRVVPHL
jgi:hypothetical protein